MQIYGLILGILAVWRVTHLFHAEDGPWELFVRLRRLAGPGFFGKLLDCFYCLSVWVAAPFALLIGQDWKECLLLWLALSGAAILLERATDRQPYPPPAAYIEDMEDPDGMLRKPETTAQHEQPGTREQ